MQIIPSLVEQTPEDLFSILKRLSPFYKRYQVDIEDGIFITNKTQSIDDFTNYVKKHLPSFGKELIYDFHLMIVDFERAIGIINHLTDFVKIDTVFIHTLLHPKHEDLQNKYPQLKIGLVINPEEKVSDIVHEFDIKMVSYIQLMTIHPGPQGSPFIPNVLQKIEQLRKAGFYNKIYLDGAINEKTIPTITSLKFKPDVLCPGSYLAKTDEIEKRFNFINSKFNI